MPEADIKGEGLRKFNGYEYADVAGVGTVQVGKDPKTGLYRAKMSSELTPSGPVLIRDPVSKLWRLRTEAESASDALTDPRYAYQRAIKGERPYTWDEQTLIKRLGAQAQGLEDAYADILAVSRTEINAVRRMYANNERIIPLLQDTVTRFGIDREIGRFIDGISSEHSHDHLQADLQFQFELLDGVWPGKTMVLLDADGQPLKGLGPADASPVPLSRDRLVDGDLLKTLLSHLSEAETKTLLDIAPGEPLSTPEVNAQRLRNQLALRAEQRKTYLFDQRYRRADRATTPEAIVLQDKLEGLPGVVARELVDIATPAELQQIRLGILPQRLENLGRWALRDVRISRAYEGLYLDSVDTTDAFKLALYSVQSWVGWDAAVRIELHQHKYGGTLLGMFGEPDAATCHTLVESGNGKYQVYDNEGNALHPASDLYNSLFHTLSDDIRGDLNIDDGKSFKALLRDYALKPHLLLMVLPDLPEVHWATFDPNFMRLRAGSPTSTGEVEQLLVIADKYADVVAYSFHESANYLRGLKWLHERFPDQCFLSVHDALKKANGETMAYQAIVESIEALPELQQLMLPEQFSSLIRRLFTDDALVPLTEPERNLAAHARNLRQTGRVEEYDSVKRAVVENRVVPSEALIELRDAFEAMPQQEPIEVTAQVMADLQLAQRTIYRAKELLPLSGNQLASIWLYGGSVIAKIKGLRGLDLIRGGYTAQLTVAEAASKAIEFKGGYCSENSKVTFSILASQPRSSSIHIVKALGKIDHQYVLIGNDLERLSELVVADSWPEFPAAHTAAEGCFGFDLPPLVTLPPGPAVADYAFINDVPPGPPTLPKVSIDETRRQITQNHLKTSGYAHWTSMKSVGNTFSLPGEVPVSFEKVPLSVVRTRTDAFTRYKSYFPDPVADS